MIVISFSNELHFLCFEIGCGSINVHELGAQAHCYEELVITLQDKVAEGTVTLSVMIHNIVLKRGVDKCN